MPPHSPFEERGWILGNHPSVKAGVERFCDQSEPIKYGMGPAPQFEQRYATDVVIPKFRVPAKTRWSEIYFYNLGQETTQGEAYRFLNANQKNGEAGMIVMDDGRITAIIVGQQGQAYQNNAGMSSDQKYYTHYCIANRRRTVEYSSLDQESSRASGDPAFQEFLVKVGILTVSVASIAVLGYITTRIRSQRAQSI